MSRSDFVDWVTPAAEELRESRSRIVEVAHALPGDAWGKPSPLAGWTYHDLLAHLAVGDWAFQATLSAILEGRGFDPALFDSLDETNERYRAERVGRPLDQLISEVIEEGGQTQALLSRLTAGHEAMPVGRFTIGEWVTGFSRHDGIHTDELATAAQR